jgi:hypothetical protein
MSLRVEGPLKLRLWRVFTQPRPNADDQLIQLATTGADIATATELDAERAAGLQETVFQHSEYKPLI